MISVLRFVGLVNAAIWLGAAVFFNLAAAPAFFSTDMREIFGATAFPYYSEATVQVVMKRYFMVHYVCGAIGLLHIATEWLYLGRPLKTIKLVLLLGIIAVALMGSVWLQPKLRTLHRTVYFAPQTEQRENARQSFKVWHAVSRIGESIALVGLLVYFWRGAVTPDSPRFANLTKFRS